LRGRLADAIVVEVAFVKLPLVKLIVMLVATLCERLVKVTKPLTAVRLVVPCKCRCRRYAWL
jgi:hypothetical protein